MNRSIRWLVVGAVAVGALVAAGCADEITDGAGGAATMSSNASTSTTMSSTSANMSTTTNASSSSGGIGPCVLDSSNVDECTLQ
jgi:outer membrane murein-binding lipoprotein Lpp